MLKRHVLWWLIVFELVCSTLVTMSMNIAIVAMVNGNYAEESSLEEPSENVLCPNTSSRLRNLFLKEEKNTSISVQMTTFDWSKTEQNMVLSGFFWFNCFSMLPGGVLSHKYGSKRVVGYAMMICCGISSAIPLVAGYGAMAVCWMRAIQGFLSAVAAPVGIYAIIGNWSPPQERGKFGASFAVGIAVSGALGDFVFGYVSQYLHWKYVFHLTTVCGVVWCVLWYYLVYDSPSQHPCISIEEKEFIENSLKSSQNAKVFIPWREICTSAPVIICVVASNSAMWAFVMMNTYPPVYLKMVYGMKSNEIGLIMSAPSLIMSILSVGIAYCADIMVKKGHLSIISMTDSRKYWCFLLIRGCVVSSMAIVIIGFTKCDLNLIIVCLLFVYITRGFAVSGVHLCVIDLSPKFCGVLEGITGTCSGLQLFVFSWAINYFTAVLDVVELWKMTFLFTAFYCIAANAVFLIFGTSQVQPWNFDDEAGKMAKYSENSTIQEANTLL